MQKNRVMRITRKPKLNNQLAAEILDPRFYYGFSGFCDKLALWVTKYHKIQTSPDAVECVARFWADQAGFKPEDKFESTVFAALTELSKDFAGWKPSPELELSDDLPDDNHDDELEVQL